MIPPCFSGLMRVALTTGTASESLDTAYEECVLLIIGFWLEELGTLPYQLCQPPEYMIYILLRAQ